MNSICEAFTPDVKTVALVGHVHPDGDCYGSVLGMYHYLRDNMPEIEVTVYLEKAMDFLDFLKEGIEVREDDGAGEKYDIVMSLDCSESHRIGAGKTAFDENTYTVCIDHHLTNAGFATINHIVPNGSSCAEVLCGLFDMDKVSLATATCLYTGIIHDTGVFRYECVQPSTMICGAKLIEKGVPFDKIIQHTITDVDYASMQLMGEVFEMSEMYDDGTVLVGKAPKVLQRKYGLTPTELGAIVAEMNKARGVECTVFMYQYEDGSWKGSLRSKDTVDVAKIAAAFGGGGHIKAAGFSVQDGGTSAAVNQIRALVKEQLNA